MIRFDKDNFVLLYRIDTTTTGHCFALSHNKFGQMKSVEVEQSTKVCFDTHRCFVSKDINLRTADGLHPMLHCDGDDATRCGVVACKTPTSGYYPAGFFSTRNGLCAFGTVLPVRSLEPLHKAIQEIIGEPLHLEVRVIDYNMDAFF